MCKPKLYATLIVALFASFLASCKTTDTEVVYRNVYHTDTLYQVRETHDTLQIYQKDSILTVKEARGDTFYIETIKYRDRWRNAATAQKDTLGKSKNEVDTVYIQKEVTTDKPNAETFNAGFKVGMAVIILLLVLLWLGWRTFKSL